MKPFAVAILATMMVASFSVDARNTRLELSLQEVVQSDEAKAAGLDGSVHFYMAGQGPSVASRMGQGVANRKTNALNKTDVEACRWVAISALLALQQSAKKQGANAVVDIVSFYKKNEFRSATNFECYVGGLLAGVALKGTYARVR